MRDWRYHLAFLLVVIVPFIGFMSSIYVFWGWGINKVDFFTLLALHIGTGWGVTIGYHRLFTHRSFETHKAIEFIFLVLGSMSLEGDIRSWAAQHRRHHKFSDKEEDPHSPHLYAKNLWGSLRGLWHAHVGWLFSGPLPERNKYAPDLVADTFISKAANLTWLWFLIGLLIPTLTSGFYYGSVGHALLGFLWGGLVRIFIVHHTTWSINSICHVYGSQPYQTADKSKNNAVIGIWALGEGWHNNHHAFPRSARHGLEWWQFDSNWLIIKVLEKTGLAWNVCVPSEIAIRIKKIPAQ